MEQTRARRAAEFEANSTGYLRLQSHQFSTIGIGLNDSPRRPGSRSRSSMDDVKGTNDAAP